MIVRMSSFTSLEGKLLIAMPSLQVGHFMQSVVFLCAHSKHGAMGLIVNKAAPLMFFSDMLEKVELKRPLDSVPGEVLRLPVRLGGPVEQFRGFVLHSNEYDGDGSSLKIQGGYRLTATIDVLAAIAEGRGPLQRIVALGYSGWAPGQLEGEIQNNGWLHCDADSDLIFSEVLETKYSNALKKLGVDPRMLSSEVGHG
jgi:putative transcriptional regulator